MFKRGNPGCPCCACPVTFELLGCNGCVISGADVDWVFGGATVFTGTTDSNGRLLNPEAPTGATEFHWSIPGTALSGTATGTVTTPCTAGAAGQVISHTLTAPPGYTCYTNCATPYPSLFVTDTLGTRALGACVVVPATPPNNFARSYRTTLTSTGTCASPVWTLRLLRDGGFSYDGECPQLSPAFNDQIISAGCARPFSFAGTYATAPTLISLPTSDRSFLIHE